MGRLLLAFCFSSLSVGWYAPASGQVQIPVLVIENVGNSDRAIIPMVISSSEDGLVAGRAIALRDTGQSKVQTYVIPMRLVLQFVKSIPMTKGEGSDSLKSFGTIRFVIVLDGKVEQSMFARKEHAIEILRSLESLAGHGAVQDDLADLRGQLEAVGNQVSQ